MVGDIVNGLLSGMPVGQNISSMFGDPLFEKRSLGHYFSAVRVDAFEDQAEFEERLRQLAEDLRDEPRVDEDVPVRVPGDPEKDTRSTRESEGIPIPEHDMERFDDIADERDVDPIVH
jgi:LDH2 family malate/lactate/ureidoglycolate dehydrogenase